VALARIAQLVQQQRAQLGGLRCYDGSLSLQLESLNEVAQRGKARRDERGRRGGADGNADALKDRSLTLFGNAVVLDVGFDIAK